APIRRAATQPQIFRVLLPCSRDLPALHSFPTRRSSDLCRQQCVAAAAQGSNETVGGALPNKRLKLAAPVPSGFGLSPRVESAREDRKSTRLNSSHVSISYAVFCLKKKTMSCAPRRRCAR